MPAVKKASQLLCRPILTTDAIARSEVRLVGPSKIARPSFSCRWRVLARRISNELVPDGLPGAIIDT